MTSPTRLLLVWEFDDHVATFHQLNVKVASFHRMGTKQWFPVGDQNLELSISSIPIDNNMECSATSNATVTKFTPDPVRRYSIETIHDRTGKA